MEGYCLDSTIENGITMLCRMSLRKGSYLRLYLSKGWSRYLLRESDPNSSNYGKYYTGTTEVKVDICSVVNSKRLEGLEIPLLCTYHRVDRDSGKSLVLKLPYGFKEIYGGKLLERPEFKCKILHAYQINEDKLVPNSIPIHGKAVTMKRNKGRMELRYPMRHNIEDLPMGKGFLDLQLTI